MMQTKGDRVERVQATLVEMGVPVFNGAFSTFLAVLTLSLAVSYSMRTFFKQFASVCIFGGAHALMVLPVVLSFIGPEPFRGRGEGEEGQELKEVQSSDADAEAGTD